MLYKHQQEIINRNPKKHGIFLSSGSGKTRISLTLARGNTLVIAPKTQVEDKNWQRELEKINNPNKIQLTVISKERFRIDYLNVPDCDTLILEECHGCVGCSPSIKYVNRKPQPQTSQIFEKILHYIQNRHPSRIYLVSATPAPTPMSVWGIAQLLGIDWDFYRFRDTFYIELTNFRKNVFVPKKNKTLEEKLIFLIHSLGTVVSLQDCFDVPPQTYKTIYVEQTSEQRRELASAEQLYPEPLVYRTKAYGIENGVHYTYSIKDDKLEKQTALIKDNKMDYIKSLTDEFPKVLIFALFTAQIEKIANTLKKQRKTVFTLTGKTKDRGKLLTEAENCSQCIVIAQSGISSGYELSSFRTVIFASHSGRYIDRIQAEGRVQRVNNIQKNLYVSLVTKGGVDEKCYKTIMNKQDFFLRMTNDEKK